MVENLENQLHKFEEEFNNNSGRWFARMILEPTYTIRNIAALREEAKRDPNSKKDEIDSLNSLYYSTIVFEAMRLAGYGLLTYIAADTLIK